MKGKKIITNLLDKCMKVRFYAGMKSKDENIRCEKFRSRNSWKKIDNSLPRTSVARYDFSYFRWIISEIPSISLVKGCSDQREILSDATDKILICKSIESMLQNGRTE